ncbi:uncharacterized protein LOC122018933 [Zingiber officinale]|uniref:uncharacterized protein LOC122018933 n=1 Tax=Zingiber officinale TaxID=94328 RepID=UPI001C4BD5F9|nr:uncharacterized protein LOC122018933 [Zingiber officinale]XP_042432353.1 uncharacterized protein LOC122018933 [Zingiber officinale]XP_042432361.1 uncharacterized protein LOC122018933 [Zingiber officinale]XP_042432366.1 uncharacterized protein LOC122018933 [Zingiber officinale]XP_042432375.1 uncharacterized protein LOC122018933 [Zingiber officinale]XP_042432385.1 uncharacterized protein LOC122018933 [Zingiber officinale]
MDPHDPHWRTNSSYSPHLSRRWDCSSQPPELSNRVHEVPLTGSSYSLSSKSGRQTCDLNHHHSVSDGAVSLTGSPSDHLQPRCWTPCMHRYDLGEFSIPTGGGRPEACVFSRGSEGYVSVANSIGSPFSPLESSRWSSASKQPRQLSNRWSFISKPIYPLVFQNPVSDADVPGTAEASSSGARMHQEDIRASPMWSERTWSPELKFHRALTELQKMEASSELSMSSRREGFRWSNASSYDFRFDGDGTEIRDNIDVENERYPNDAATYQKCELCKRSLHQKSPWSSNQIIKNGDMPVAGILPCHHVFHADCLEETTPKDQIHEPPCPVCLKATGVEKLISFSEPLHVALKSSIKSHGMGTFSEAGTTNNLISHQCKEETRQNNLLAAPQHTSSSMRNHIKKLFSFKSKIGKEFQRSQSV